MTHNNRARFQTQLEEDLLRDVERLHLGAPAERATEYAPEHHHHDVSDRFRGRTQVSDRFHGYAQVSDPFHSHMELGKRGQWTKGGLHKPSLERGRYQAIAAHNFNIQKKAAKNRRNKGGRQGGKNQSQAEVAAAALKVSDPAAYQTNTEETKKVVKGALAYLAKNLAGFPDITQNWYTKVYQYAADRLPKGNDKTGVSEVDLSTDPTAKEYSVAVAAAITAQDGKVPDWLRTRKVTKKELGQVRGILLYLLQAHYSKLIRDKETIPSDLQTIVEAVIRLASFVPKRDTPSVPFTKFSRLIDSDTLPALYAPRRAIAPGAAGQRQIRGGDDE